MSAPLLSCSRRLRRTPFSRRVEAAGIKAYTVYNHMLLPTSFDKPGTDYFHLKEHVQVWDVACERQVELKGPDALKLAQMMTPRSLAGLTEGKCLYTPVVDENGGMLNDPVTLKVGDDRYWMSIADSDVMLLAKGLAAGAGLDAEVFEPDVSPLAVQGPKADELAARVFGDAVRDIRFFGYARLPFEDTNFVVARSGYSAQGGFEIYVEDGRYGEAVWDALFAAGGDLNVRAGYPNTIERIEAGLLSYGNDMTIEDTPYECSLGKYVHLDKAVECIGIEALRRHAERGHSREIRGLRIDGEPLPGATEAWAVSAGGKAVGHVSSAAWSPSRECTVALAMMNASHWTPGSEVEVDTPEGPRGAEVSALPFSEA